MVVDIGVQIVDIKFIYSFRPFLWDSGESLFLRKLVLGIPAQASGKNLTRPLMPSAPQTSCVRATSPHHRKLGAGYVALPQMTGRRFGKPFILSPPTLALRFRQNNGPTPTGDYQPSRSLSMAGSVSITKYLSNDGCIFTFNQCIIIGLSGA